MDHNAVIIFILNANDSESFLHCHYLTHSFCSIGANQKKYVHCNMDMDIIKS